MERSHEFTITVPGEGTYVIKLLEGVELEQQDGAMICRWPAFDLDGESEACGTHDAPGRRFGEFTSWVRSTAEPVSAEVLAQEAADKRAYEVARETLTAITPDDIAAESSTGVPLLVDFWAAWCGPCRQVTPVLKELAEQRAGRIVVRKIDVDQFDGIWDRFNFRGIAAMLMFKD